MRPWAMNFSDYSKRGVDIFWGFTALENRPIQCTYKIVPYCNSQSSKVYTIPGEHQQSLRRVATGTANQAQQDDAEHTDNLQDLPIAAACLAITSNTKALE